MDIVYIRDLRIDAVIGIYEWEKRIKQQININLEMGWDNSVPAASDDIKHTLNYKACAKLVKDLVNRTEYELVETLAEKIAELLLNEMKIPWIKVAVGKPMAVTNSKEVGVIIERFQTGIEEGKMPSLNKKKQITEVYLDIGSNIDREKNIQSCVDELQIDFPDIVFSKAYESEAEGFDGDPFINLSAKLHTELSFDELNAYLKNIENKHARKRDNDKFISRTLDVDILLFGDQVLQPEKDLPRAEILKFPFVLFPLSEIAGDFLHPVEKITISEIVKKSNLDKNTLTEVKNFPTLTTD